MNSHFSSGQVRPLLPNMVEVGGLQVKQKSDRLPEVKLLISLIRIEILKLLFNLEASIIPR